jgi:hypothetical protein
LKLPFFPSNSISGYAFDRIGTLSLAADISGNVFSVDSTNWNFQEIAKVPTAKDIDWIAIFCCDLRGQFYLGGKSMGLLRSSDKGISWERVSAPAFGQDISINDLQPGPLGRPSIYSDQGVLQASSEGKLCVSDKHCLKWSVSKIASRASLGLKLLRLNQD